MPVEGLPDMLETLLGAIAGANKLNSWSIYQEKDASVTVKLRFKQSDAASSAANHIQHNAGFKRKSDNQVH